MKLAKLILSNLNQNDLELMSNKFEHIKINYLIELKNKFTAVLMDISTGNIHSYVLLHGRQDLWITNEYFLCVIPTFNINREAKLLDYKKDKENLSLDNILDKISLSGKNSLTASEKQFLAIESTK